MSISFQNYLTAQIQAQLDSNGWSLGRITSAHRDRYTLCTEQGFFDAEVTGAFRYMAALREDFPAVGDYVAIGIEAEDFALIHQVLPRLNVLRRENCAKEGETQIIAANLDAALLVQALDRDYNLNRLERYLSLCHSSRIEPIVVLTKADLNSSEQVDDLRRRMTERQPGLPVYALSSLTGEGLAPLQELLQPGLTYCLLGSSGAGKSTLLNSLLGYTRQHTISLSESTGKGRHATTRRELLELPNGALVIDNPGMREIALACAGEGIEDTFGSIARLSKSCHFSDCSHDQEKGCAVQAAVQRGELAPEALLNYQKLQRENAHFESSAAQRREKDRAFGKMLKNYQKLKNEN